MFCCRRLRYPRYPLGHRLRRAESLHLWILYSVSTYFGYCTPIVYCGFGTIFPLIEDIADVVQCRVAQIVRSWELRAEQGETERRNGAEKERVRDFDPQKISPTRAKKGAFLR